MLQPFIGKKCNKNNISVQHVILHILIPKSGLSSFFWLPDDYSVLAEKFNKIDVTNLLIFYLDVLDLSQIDHNGCTDDHCNTAFHTFCS
ncbi:hypothetical protein T11_12829 [Trichinella zimbabwensis]|uniref:Uncharacterized protein n=1 Tax=Trichinella zimbabwensis TaxID=268475 RepID=A0A0V1GVN0_9BILA|nr:hypothetical protein T11_12829 [Trichinella zimbabwensis]